jgi:hypothetical protein
MNSFDIVVDGRRYTFSARRLTNSFELTCNGENVPVDMNLIDPRKPQEGLRAIASRYALDLALEAGLGEPSPRHPNSW